MEPIGVALREARERKGITIQDVKQALRIQGPYLEALEADEFERLPAPAYARAFLRQYAVFLGVHPEPILDAYNARAGNEPPSLNVGWTAAPQAEPSWSSKAGIVGAGLMLGLALVGAYEVRIFLVGKEDAQRQAASVRTVAPRAQSSPAPVSKRPPVPPGTAMAARPGQPASPTHAPKGTGMTAAPGSSGAKPAGSTAGPAAAGVAQGTPSSAPAPPGANAARPAADAPSSAQPPAIPSPVAAATGPASAALPSDSAASMPPPLPGSSGTPAGGAAGQAAPAGSTPGGLNGESATPAEPAAPPAVGPGSVDVAAAGQPLDGGVQVTVSARQRCWVRVRSDGKVTYEGTLRAGEARSWRGTAAVEVLLGNAGGVRLAVNGQDLGPAGKPGQVVRRVFRGASGSGDA